MATAIRELRDPFGWAIAALALIVNLALSAGPLKAVAVAVAVLAVKAAAGIFWPRPPAPPAPAVAPARRGQRKVGSPLTEREIEVAKWVARGLTDRQIGYKLVPQVQERGVEKHLSNIREKLDFHSRAEIAAWYTRNVPDKPDGR